MDDINYIFFEEFKRLETLCNEMYGNRNGVTHYIDEMKSVPYHEFHLIPGWKTDLKQLVRLRHIRNQLAHVEGSFMNDICSSDDITWIQAFYNRILNLTDPLAILHQSTIQPEYSNQKESVKEQNIKESMEEPTKSSTFFSITIILLTIIICLALVFIALATL